jgi:tetratricopeptide (TPR) repeat protein
VSGWRIENLSEMESLPGPETLRWTPVRKRLGITAFGINAYTAQEAGQDVVEEHDEARLGHEEVYVVVSGRATFVLGGEERDVPAGSLVYLSDPGVTRYARAEEPGTTVLAVGGKPGQHEISAWEYFFEASAKAAAGDVEAGLAEIDAGLAARPDHPALHYHRACMLVRLGRLEEAQVHLDRAIEIDDFFAEHARTDEDVAALRIPG